MKRDGPNREDQRDFSRERFEVIVREVFRDDDWNAAEPYIKRAFDALWATGNVVEWERIRDDLRRSWRVH